MCGGGFGSHCRCRRRDGGGTRGSFPGSGGLRPVHRLGIAERQSGAAYAAMLEVGRAQKTIFVARYLRLRDLQREIEEGLNVMESSNGANSVTAYGKGGEIASNRRDEQEMFVLCLQFCNRP
ncbi:Tn3 family transposase [Nocardia grenadensis]|uniref:Tn3 family transposase n=1 Tax=Nocardia grenadensis TaxID=931537 RepID=UPI003D91DE99